MRPQRKSTIKNVLYFLLALYLFLLSISVMGSAFKLLGKDFSQKLIEETSNPLEGVFIGLLATSIIQSSSATTSIIVSMVSAGIMNIGVGIPIIMGANMGTCVTNTLVSMVYIKRKEDFRRAFSGAIVHDIFNFLNVLILLPLELKFHLIQRTALFMTREFESTGATTFVSPLAIIINPLKEPVLELFSNLPHGAWLAIITSIICLFIALKFITKFMKVIMLGKVRRFVDEYLFKNDFVAFLLGLTSTAIIQSSSITTSLLVPLVGAGIVTLEQIFPFVMGANIGTTITAILASLATITMDNQGTIVTTGVTIAFVHLLYNSIGTIIWYPLRVIPITLARKITDLTIAKSRVAVLYILVLFFGIPILGVLIL